MKQEVNGYLTVFFALTLTIIITFCLTVIEGARRSTLALEADCVTDIGMNSIFAEFHRELLDQYNLFFVDTSYGTAVCSYDKTGEHLREYMNRNFQTDQWALPIFSRDLLALQAEEVTVLGASVASDEEGAVLRRQAVECIKEQVGVEYATKIMEWMQLVTDADIGAEEWMGQESGEPVQEWVETLEGTQGEVYVVQNPTSGLLGLFKNGILNLVVDTEQISTRRIQIEDYLSHREKNVGTGMNPAYMYEDTLLDTILFHQYILKQTGRYGAPKENGALLYQTEYILGGKASDVDNLKYVVDRLFLIREAMNALHIVGDEKKMTEVEQLSQALAMLTTVPETAPLFKVSLIGAWAGLESVWDVKLLLDGESVPLLKMKEEWFFDFTSMTAVQNMSDIVSNQAKEGEGLSYEDYLGLMLLCKENKTVTYRMMDIIEMDIRLTKGNHFFRMDGCIDSIAAQVTINSAYGYEFLITRRYGY